MAKNTWVLRKRNSQNKSFIEKKTRLKKKNQFERREKSQTTPVAQVAKVDPKPLSYSKFRSRKKKENKAKKGHTIVFEGFPMAGPFSLT